MYEEKKNIFASDQCRSWDSIRIKLVENSRNNDTINKKPLMHEGAFFKTATSETRLRSATAQ